MAGQENENASYAIFQSGGKQYTVKAGDKVLVEKLGGEVGKEVSFEEVLLLRDGKSGEVKVGAPILDSSSVTGRIVAEKKDRKVIAFKKRRRQGYKLKQGHRQQRTEVLIEAING